MGGMGGGASKVLPLQKGERENTFWGSFNTARSFNHTGGGVTKSVHPFKRVGGGGGHEKFYRVLRGERGHNKFRTLVFPFCSPPTPRN